jgi:hypothetical protein
VRATRDRVRRLTTGVAAVALLILGLSTLPAHAYPGAAVEPSDALTLVRQALAALEVTPPADLVATGKILKALFARDTRGVDMAHVHEAAQAIGMRDSAAAAAQLIDALRPARMGPGGIDVALLVPFQPHFAGTPTAYILLVGAALLLATGGLIVRR